MKKLISVSSYVLLGIFLIFTSCTKDEIAPVETQQDVFTPDSPLSNLIIRTSQNSSTPDAIDCIDFVYPITFFIYDASNQQTGTQTVNSDLELLQFLLGLNGSSSIAIDFPIEVILQDGTIVEVNSNSDLQTLISDCTSNSNPVPTEFEQILTSDSWFITYFFDDIDETSNYSGYEFTFATDHTAQATNGSNTVDGTWSLTSGSTPDLNLFFGTVSPFDELDEDWDIIEATQEIIRLKHVSGGNGDVDFLTFERTPNTGGGGGGGGGTGALADVLIDGSWFVTLLNDDGNDETCDYQAYEFTFNNDFTVMAVSPNNTVNGTWNVTNSSSGVDLVLNFDITGPNDPFDDLNDDWDVLSFDAQSIQLIDVSGGNGGTDYLNFGREPVTGCGGGGGGGSAQALEDVLQDGEWFVQSYIDDGDDETSDYNGYVLTFNADGTVNAVNGATTLTGNWSVTSSSSGLDVILDFGTQFPFDEFNDDWDVSNFTDTLVELFDVSGGNGGTDYLTFAKL